MPAARLGEGRSLTGTIEGVLDASATGNRLTGCSDNGLSVGGWTDPKFVRPAFRARQWRVFDVATAGQSR